ncbi:hypothetical protein INR49_006031 [Caranx melampygus]|nr:hypothetical protein INR49_006031 [Caranx melampygus]
MSDRLSSLFGMIRKKEEKKEEVQQHPKEESPAPAPRSDLINRSLTTPPTHLRTFPSVQILKLSEPADCQTPSQLCPSPATSDSTLSSVPSESPDHFSNLHSSLAPPTISQSPSGSPVAAQRICHLWNLRDLCPPWKRREGEPPCHPRIPFLGLKLEEVMVLSGRSRTLHT